MNKLLTGGALVACLLAAPSVAAAHTGSAVCGANGSVEFRYNANFAGSTSVTEQVTDATTGNGIVKTFVVPAHTAVTDSVTGAQLAAVPAGPVLVAQAHWSDNGHSGSIVPVELRCDTPPPNDQIPFCKPSETVTRTVYTPGPEVTKYVDVPGATVYVDRWHTKIKFKTKTKIKTVIRWRTAPLEPIKRQIRRGAGVTG